MAHRFGWDDLKSQHAPGVLDVRFFTLVTTAQFTPICANPLAADVNPVFRLKPMFHVASKKGSDGDTVIVLRDWEFQLKNTIGLHLLSNG
jgi:hypothetical protein